VLLDQRGEFFIILKRLLN